MSDTRKRPPCSREIKDGGGNVGCLYVLLILLFNLFLIALFGGFNT